MKRSRFSETQIIGILKSGGRLSVVDWAVMRGGGVIPGGLVQAT
jgi:hypothetical protein